MANEKRLDLIDRNKLLPNKVFYVCSENPVASLDELLNRIANAKTVDAVEVVRCKDCENSRAIKETDPHAHEYAKDCVWCMAHEVGFGRDDFCSYGERRDG